jgi:hypothetical protein
LAFACGLCGLCGELIRNPLRGKRKTILFLVAASPRQGISIIPEIALTLSDLIGILAKTLVFY